MNLNKPINIAILGSTGSIGTQTLDIISEYPHMFRASVLCAHKNWRQLAEQALLYRPDSVVITEATHKAPLTEALRGSDIKVYGGYEMLNALVADSTSDIIVAAMVGYSGLSSVIAAAKAGKRIALANKETLVAAGSLITELCSSHGAELIPVDSEHSAIFQCLVGEEASSIHRIILTASGGPFRTFSKQQLKAVTPADALRHPNWQMGHKVTIDSASMMNKGFEMIEAHWLFDCDPEKIEILVHPQSIVHSMVEFTDGSLKAQLGVPDMRLPIRYALGHPHRLTSDRQRLDLAAMRNLYFEPADTDRFPMLDYAFEAIRRGGTMPAIMAAADEIAVQAFLDRKIGFMDIANIVRDVMSQADVQTKPDYAAIIDADAQGRARAVELIENNF